MVKRVVLNYRYFLREIKERMAGTFDFDRIMDSFKQDSLPPLHLWKPALSGDINIHIDKQGIWRHCGDEFKRLQIPKMFARILCKEGNEYFLKTPVEKWRIRVEDVPFFFIHMQRKELKKGIELSFVTITEDIVTLNEDHPIVLFNDQVSGEVFPYIHVRGAMYGKLSRNLYYELVALAEVDEDQQKLYISSANQRFFLGDF